VYEDSNNAAISYIEYWQLINAVDEFVLLDNADYIMCGYINSILINRNTLLFLSSIMG
jgi:uncharacterized protein YunC (DUF1805 family)